MDLALGKSQMSRAMDVLLSDHPGILPGIPTLHPSPQLAPQLAAGGGVPRSHLPGAPTPRLPLSIFLTFCLPLPLSFIFFPFHDALPPPSFPPSLSSISPATGNQSLPLSLSLCLSFTTSPPSLLSPTLSPVSAPLFLCLVVRNAWMDKGGKCPSQLG